MLAVQLRDLQEAQRLTLNDRPRGVGEFDNFHNFLLTTAVTQILSTGREQADCHN